jgi:hypothetical protein
MYRNVTKRLPVFLVPESKVTGTWQNSRTMTVLYDSAKVSKVTGTWQNSRTMTVLYDSAKSTMRVLSDWPVWVWKNTGI